ncbi:endoplasmic reticulum resident protein 27 [Anomaloglossus baeobatrachus]|uniref:endoplasmic reticulum resident protein 27 n=1 Tax=Anomaloglossus baeobatrachus TaxID=238106 RepID=UPI003F50C3CD
MSMTRTSYRWWQMCGSQASELHVTIYESSSLRHYRADTMTRPSCCVQISLLLLLVNFSLAAETGNSTDIEVPERRALELGDVPTAKAFIESTEIAVVGFFVDPETPEFGYFNTIVKNHPEWDYGITTSTDVLRHYKIDSNAISIFRQADNFRDDMVVALVEELSTAKLYRFLTINELRLVTDYNPMTAIGLIACKVQIHLIFFTHKDVKEQEEIIRELREAAKELRGQVLFVKMDVNTKSNQKIMSFFKLKKSDLPLISIYDTESNRKQIMKSDEITAESVKTFCLDFLSGAGEDESENVKTEL